MQQCYSCLWSCLYQFERIFYSNTSPVSSLYAISFNASVAARPALSITLRHDPTVERHTRTRTQPGRDGTDIDQLKTNVGYQKKRKTMVYQWYPEKKLETIDLETVVGGNKLF